MAIAGAVAIAVLMAVYVAKLRRKETRFGCVSCHCLSWAEGRDSITVPNQKSFSFSQLLDLVASLLACILTHLDVVGRHLCLKEQQSTVVLNYRAMPCFQLCLHICLSDFSLCFLFFVFCFTLFWIMCLCFFHREAFEPMMESGELVVRYRARRTYSRRTTEATREFPLSLPLHVPKKYDTLCLPVPALTDPKAVRDASISQHAQTGLCPPG